MRSVFWIIKLPCLLTIVGYLSLVHADETFSTSQPSITITAPSKNILIENKTSISLSVSYSGEYGVDLSSVNISMDGAPNNHLCDIQLDMAKCQTAQLSIGVHTVSAVVMDFDGDVAFAEQSFLFLNKESPLRLFASVWHGGDSLPLDLEGRDSDLFLDERTSDVYQKRFDSWEVLFNSAGEAGMPGPKGAKGDKGLVGDRGQKGRVGEPGDIGETGVAGSKGAVGDVGPQGAFGPKGETGDVGSVGLAGMQGPKGKRGDSGESGLSGAKGIKGEKGKDFYVAMYCPSGQAVYGFDSEGGILCR